MSLPSFHVLREAMVVGQIVREQEQIDPGHVRRRTDPLAMQMLRHRSAPHSAVGGEAGEMEEPFKNAPGALSSKWDQIAKSIKRNDPKVDNPYAVAWSTVKKMGAKKEDAAEPKRWKFPSPSVAAKFKGPYPVRTHKRRQAGGGDFARTLTHESASPSAYREYGEKFVREDADGGTPNNWAAWDAARGASRDTHVADVMKNYRTALSGFDPHSYDSDKGRRMAAMNYALHQWDDQHPEMRGNTQWMDVHDAAMKRVGVGESELRFGEANAASSFGMLFRPSGPVRCSMCGGTHETEMHKLFGERDFDPNVGGGTDRDKMPASDFAGKDRSFPIKTKADVDDALHSIGRAGSDNYGSATLKKNIHRIAKRKGFERRARAA